MKPTYKSLRRRIAEKQKQLQRAQALCQRLDDQLFALRERMWQTEQCARLRKEAALKWIADIEALDTTTTE
jgi:predicted  nucleic acid-binding Zn-ribbon protein